ncbi:MAG: hypothetical protein QG622_2417 [Actinomycetota bacterium]|nr:hypothetical protein [Actinomycetota bacterium]
MALSGSRWLPIALACTAGLVLGGGTAALVMRSGDSQDVPTQSSSAQGTPAQSSVSPSSSSSAGAPGGGTVPAQAMVSFTFDDGKKNQYQNAMTTLDKAGFKGTFYVIGGAIDDWPEFRAKYMDATEVKTLSKNHEVVNHTWNHENLADLAKGKTPAAAEAAIKTEIAKTQEKIAKVIGAPPKTCAYPFGGVNPLVVKVAKQYLSACRTTTVGLNSPADDLYQLQIFYMTSKTTSADLDKALKDAKTENKWLILCYHDVTPADDASDEYDVTTAAFTSQVQAVKKTGLPVKTVAQALGLAGA